MEPTKIVAANVGPKGKKTPQRKAAKDKSTERSQQSPDEPVLKKSKKSSQRSKSDKDLT